MKLVVTLIVELLVLTACIIGGCALCNFLEINQIFGILASTVVFVVLCAIFNVSSNSEKHIFNRNDDKHM